MSVERQELLRLDRVSRSFPGVKALDGVTLVVRSGEVHGLVGENGAGKSTLMAVASGALRADEGSVTLCGVEVRGEPDQARRLGLAIVRQEPALMPELTVAENLYLGVPQHRRPGLWSVEPWAATLLRGWSEDAGISPSDRVESLGPEQRFIVEIVKALASHPRVLVLDEPTEHLAGDDVQRLFTRIRSVTDQGCAVVYISHRIREVRQIAHRITVLRDGKGQGTYDTSDLTEDRIVELIVGRDLPRDFPLKPGGLLGHPIVLDVSSLHGRGFSAVSLQARAGEILGLAGIDGNGQREFLRALAGLEAARGTVAVNGRPVSLGHTKDAADAGIRIVPGDRHRDGILGDLSVRENFSLRSLERDARAGILRANMENRRTAAAIARFSIKTPGAETAIRCLSGGNQQKVVLASALAAHPSVLLVDEPTQGVDVGTRMEIYATLRATAADGKAVVMLSSDAQELAGMCDRVLVFSRGRVVAELIGGAVCESAITAALLTSTGTRDRRATHIGKAWNWAAGDAAPLVMLLIAVLSLGAYAASVNDYYLTARNLGGVLPLIATLALVAFGQQLLMLVGGIDLSVGPLMGFIVVVQSFFLADGAGPEGQAVGWLLVVLAALAVGFVNWLLVDPVGLHPMAATLVTFMVLQALSLLLRPVPGGMIDEQVLEALGWSIGIFPISAAFVLLLAFLLEVGMFRSRWGLAFRGLGSRPEAARMAGVRPRLTLLAAYLGCSLLAACAAILMMAQIGSGDATAGVNYTLASIAAVVIGGARLFGGRGSFVGALLGALLITQVNVVTTFLGLSDAWQSYLLGAMILVSVAVYSKSRQKVVVV